MLLSIDISINLCFYSPRHLCFKIPTSDETPPPLILDPPHFTRRSLGYCACLNAPFDLFQLFNHRARPHTKRRNYRCLHATRIV